MKNLISYYYNLNINDYKKVDECVFFNIDNISYEFTPFYGNIDYFYRIYSLLESNNVYCHEVIINKENSMFTKYNDKLYLLIKKNIDLDKIVDINEILSYDLNIRGNYKLNWKQLWEEKIDYYEYQMNQLSFKYPNLKNSFNYYLGMTENAISLLNYINSSEIVYSISHKRILNNETLSNFLNPIDVIIDSRVRDIVEYIKINYINGNIEIEDSYKIIKNLNFNNTEAILFLSRLLYPSYYYDLYDKIIQGILDDNDIYSNENRLNYELFLKKMYLFLKKRYIIPNIEWLNN